MRKKMFFSFLIMVMAFFLASSAQAFAADIKVVFDSTDLIIGSNASDANFRGTVSNAGDFPVPTDLKMVINYQGRSYNVVEQVVYATSSYVFSGSLPFPMVSGNYNLRYYYQDVLLTTTSDCHEQIRVHYDVRATISSGTRKINEYNVKIDGRIYDKQGKAADIYPDIQVEGATITSSTCNNSIYSIQLGQITRGGPKALKLLFDSVVVASWDVEAGPLPALTISPGSFVVDSGTNVSITAMINEYYYSSYNLRNADLSNLRIEITGVPIYAASLGSFDASRSEYSSSYQDTFRRLVLSGNDLLNASIRFATTGTARFTITTLDEQYKSVVDLPVEYNGNNYGLIGAPNYQSYAGDTELNLSFNMPSNTYIREYNATITATGQEAVEIHEGGSTSSGYYYRMKPVTFSANGRGSVYIRALTTDRDGSQSEWTREFSYARPSIEISQNVVNLGEELQISVFVRDANGSPISNGWVVIDGIGSRNATGSNGEHVFKNTWNQPGYRRIQAFAADGSLLGDFAQMLKVQAPELLTVYPQATTLLIGANQTLKLTVQDENGREITGARVIARVDGAATTQTASWSGKEYSLSVTPQEKVVIYAESSDGRKVSPEIELTVAKPIVTCNRETLTANYMERLEFTFTHPSTGEPISGSLSLRTQNLKIVERNIVGGTSGSKSGTKVALDLYNRPLEGVAEPRLLVDFTYLGRTYSEILSLPVGEATTSFSPTSLRQGDSSKITLEIKGASGNGIPGIKVKLQGTSTSADGTTNDDGKVSFNVKPGSGTTKYTFLVTRTDQPVTTNTTATTFEVSIPVIGDTEDPVLNIDNLGGQNYLETDQNTYTLNLTLTDDFGLEALFVNQARYELTGTSVKRSEAINLREGDNAIALLLRDKAGHSASRDVVIRYSPPKPVVQPIVMSMGSSVIRQGAATLPTPPIAPQTISGRTMLPFRYLVQNVLGGTVDYEEATGTIRAYVNGHTITMVLNSTIILVDGAQVTLDQAPFETGGHTLAPLRAFERAVSSFAWDDATQTVTVYP